MPARHTLIPLALFAGLALVPVAASFGAEGFLLSLATRILIVALAAMSLDLLIGIGGLVSFGHAAFLGIGAYAVGILSAEGVQDGLLHLAAAISAAALFALVTGAIAIRTDGVHFIMITLAFGQMVYFLATALSAYGGDDGLTLPGRSRLLGQDVLASDRALYWTALGALALAYLGFRRLAGSRFGRVLAGTRDNPVRMQAIGFRPHRFRLAAYILAGIVAAVAGVLLANLSGFVSPATMAWQRSGDLLFVVILGGLGSLHGAILGAIAFILAEEILSHWTEHWRIVFGPMLVLAVLFARGGIAGALGALLRRTDGATPYNTHLRHAEERPQAASRSTHHDGSFFETPASRAPQNDAGGCARSIPEGNDNYSTGEALLAVQHLAKSYGALRVTDDVSFAVAPGELHALIGPNGAGKTTLIHQLSGTLAPDAGRILFAGEDIGARTMAGRVEAGLARSFQITSILPRHSALANVAMAVQARSGSSFRFLKAADRDETLNAPARAILARVGLLDRADVEAGLLSHGEKRVLEIAIALATAPRLLLLDEPLAGTSHAESRRLVELLRTLKGEVAILLVEHDMDAVFALADRVSVLYEGRIIASGTPEAIRADAIVRAAYLGEEAR